MKLTYNRPPQSPREFQVHEIMIVTSFLKCFLCSGQGSMLSMPFYRVILPTTIIPDQWRKVRREPKAAQLAAGLGVWSERPQSPAPARWAEKEMCWLGALSPAALSWGLG